jgi:4-hydroxy-tetrahydrodipicolinate synthase
MFKGSITAIVTPFKNNKVDEQKLEAQVEFQIENGITGLVPCGTTGESPTLSHEEHRRVVEIVVSAAKKRIPVIAGAGSNSTDEAVELSKHAKKVGADAVLSVSPYYNKPTQKGLYLHFEKVAMESDIPVVMYNIPGRCGVNIEPVTMAKLSKVKNIVGVKEAAGNLDQCSQIMNMCGEDFCMLSGDDSLTLPMMSVGGKGVISVIANIVPKDTSEMTAAYLKGDIAKAKSIHYKLFPLMKAALFLETNPIPIKTAMKMMGMDSGELRLPMCVMEEGNAVKLGEILKKMGLVK